ncbi:hypothetical protein KC343_g65 [Hortaea werneckii]|nr:hypothetical protein KC317_g64 [Hortaea werneckii]KAI7638473.1 hypothetical protein KC343_g65 [Hortaea werneckii]
MILAGRRVLHDADHSLYGISAPMESPTVRMMVKVDFAAVPAAYHDGCGGIWGCRMGVALSSFTINKPSNFSDSRISRPVVWV